MGARYIKRLFVTARTLSKKCSLSLLAVGRALTVSFFTKVLLI